MPSKLISKTVAETEMHAEAMNMVNHFFEEDAKYATFVMCAGVQKLKAKRPPWSKACFFQVNEIYVRMSTAERLDDIENGYELSLRSKYTAGVASALQSNMYFHVSTEIRDSLKNAIDPDAMMPYEELMNLAQFGYTFCGDGLQFFPNDAMKPITAMVYIDDRKKYGRDVWHELVICAPHKFGENIVPLHFSIPMIQGKTLRECCLLMMEDPLVNKHLKADMNDEQIDVGIEMHLQLLAFYINLLLNADRIDDGPVQRKTVTVKKNEIHLPETSCYAMALMT